MITLDHSIVRVRSQTESVRFYERILGLQHEGRAGPFEIVRVNAELTLDLLEQAPQDLVHLAFALDAASFDAVHRRLQEDGVAFGAAVFERDGRVGRNRFGARGAARSLYFYDPDGHNIEIRTYAAEPGSG